MCFNVLTARMVSGIINNIDEVEDNNNSAKSKTKAKKPVKRSDNTKSVRKASRFEIESVIRRRCTRGSDTLCSSDTGNYSNFCK